MNKTFNNVETEGKLAILGFLSEERKSISFYFNEKKAHSYFQKKYPKHYGSRERGSLLLGADGKIHLLASIETIEKEKEPILTVLVQRYNTGDADTSYDDSSVTTLKTPSNPKGIILQIPLHLLEGIHLFR